jgi:hypothetical protein
MFDIEEKFRKRGRALEPEARDCLEGQKNYQIRTIAALVPLLLALALPSPGWADIFGTVSAEGYTFTNFDPTLTGGAAGSNANGISNTGQVVGFTVSAQNVALSNYSGTPGARRCCLTFPGRRLSGSIARATLSAVMESPRSTCRAAARRKR